MRHSLFAIVGALTSTVTCSPVSSSTSSRPVVDLGYELHQALPYNSTTDSYKFANVRYGQDTSGNLRFRAPQPPKKNRHHVQTGEGPSRACPQGVPDWQSRAFGPTGNFSHGTKFTLPAWEDAISSAKVPPIEFNGAGVTEDCLFLDVYVPSKVMERAQKPRSSCEGAPVLVWIHGGGYTFGSKLGSPNPKYDPTGLIESAREFDDEGMIYVAINYRLGALGFLAGPDVEADGDLNAGYLDQRLALEWVQENIHLFGGNAERVTVMGESAGGGSILMHMTGAHVKAPFAQAIAQSPAINPLMTEPESAYGEFLSYLNVTTLAEARDLPCDVVIQANADQIAAAGANTYTYGFVRDGKYVKDHPDVLFKRGEFDKSVKLMSSHNSLEGAFFFDPNVTTEGEFRDVVDVALPGFSDSQASALLNDIYPPQFDGSMGYVDQSSRQIALWGDGLFHCNFNAAHKAFNGKSYAYEFAVSPGIHTQDLAYTFNDPTGAPFVPAAAQTMRDFIASFTINGVPTLQGDGAPERFPRWGSDEAVVRIGDKGYKIEHNAINQTRCDWWRSVHEEMSRVL